MTKQKANVLIVHNKYRIPGGEDTVVENEKQLLETNGHKVNMYIRRNEEINNLPIIKKILLPFTTIFSLKTFKEIKRIIVKENINVLCVHNTLCMISPSVYYAAFHCKIPVIQTVHNFRLICPNGLLYREGKVCEECLKSGICTSLKYKCYRDSKLQTFMVFMMLKVHRILGTYKKLNYMCLTQFNKEKLLEVNRKDSVFLQNKIYIRPNYIEAEDEIVPYESREEQYVYVGRLEESKGIFDLLNCFKEIPDKQLLIFGTGEVEEECRQFIERNCKNNVMMMGFKKHDEIMNIISKSKALLFPTRWYEGFPMTIVESFSCGTPVIGSKIGNVGNIIEDGTTGKKVSFTSGQELLDAMQMINSEISENCYRAFKENYSKDVAYKNWLRIYEEIIM